MWYKQKVRKLALNSLLLTNDVQVLILCLSYFITTVTPELSIWRILLKMNCVKALLSMHLSKTKLGRSPFEVAFKFTDICDFTRFFSLIFAISKYFENIAKPTYLLAKFFLLLTFAIAVVKAKVIAIHCFPCLGSIHI